MLIKESLESRSQISVNQATQLLGVSRCGFYKRLRSKSGQVNAILDMDVRNEIQRIAVEFPAYGYRRITAELRNRGYSVNHKRVLRLIEKTISFAFVRILSQKPPIPGTISGSIPIS